MRPIISSTAKEKKLLTKALERQREETGEVDHKELRRRILKNKKHPASPFFPRDTSTCVRLAQEQACRNIIGFFWIRYIEKGTGEQIEVKRYIGVPTKGAFFPTGDRRQVRYERAKEYQKDPEKVQRVYHAAREEFLELCRRYYHNRLARPLCVSIRRLVVGGAEKRKRRKA